MKLNKILIANRGEIAARIIRACNELGCRTVAVYSRADRMQPHVRMADEAYEIGPPAAEKSYLVVEKLLHVARVSGADAVHPGYGFLAENADAAEAFEQAGLSWIGPPTKAIRLMGDKLNARATAAAAGLPVVPAVGKQGEMRDDDLIVGAEEIGYPLLVKAAAGGGGKGMRIVHDEDQLAEGLRLARLEAEASFGHSRVYLERLITNARHVEIQILGDRDGNVVHLGERDCSIQRRHQKLIEEAPSSTIDEGLRHEMGMAAVRVAKAVGYHSAGTVEFVFDRETRRYYFLEMNTRLQVEHTVTEMVTGVDIVKEMLRVARGQSLRYRQIDIVMKGAAIECRILAEDPRRNFIPSIGHVAGLSLPSGPGVRVDTGIAYGSAVTPFYDSLIAKLIVWDETRDEAIIRTRRALEEFQITGVMTTIPFFIQLLGTAEFRSGKVHTRYLEDEFMLRDARDGEAIRIAAVAAAKVAHRRTQRAMVLNTGNGLGSPWKDYGIRRAMSRRLS